MKNSQPLGEDNLPFAKNPDSRCPVVLVFDSSYSMSANGRIDKLNSGLQRLMSDINSDVLARRRIDLAIIQCGGSAPQLVQPMVTVQDIVENTSLPKFAANGGTPMDAACNMALDVISSHKSHLKQNNIQFYKSMFFVLSDGEFHTTQATTDRLHLSEESNEHAMFSVGVGNDVNVSDLACLSSKGRAFLLDDTDFSDLFEFISASLASVSQSSPGSNLTVAIPSSMTVVERKGIEL